MEMAVASTSAAATGRPGAMPCSVRPPPPPPPPRAWLSRYPSATQVAKRPYYLLLVRELQPRFRSSTSELRCRCRPPLQSSQSSQSSHAENEENEVDEEEEDEEQESGSRHSAPGTAAPKTSSSAREGEGGETGAAATRIPYGLVTGLASVGFAETAYLTWAKIAGTTVTCSVGVGGGGSCGDVLDSSYATVFGVPLSLIGMVAYGAIALVGGVRAFWSGSGEDWEAEESRVRWVVLAGTTSMAAASAYFMYILTTKLEGTSCPYCVGSAVLSASLLLSALRGFSARDVGLMAGVQMAVGASVVVGLSVAFGDSNAAFARSQELDLPSVEPEVLTVSSTREISLAKHLRSVGARMYGAFWCSHCFEQKQMFGREAMKYLDYVECYPDGYRKGVQIAQSCNAANIQGFPTWIINGKTLSGEQGLADLARASGFDSSVKFK